MDGKKWKKRGKYGKKWRAAALYLNALVS